MKTSPLELAAFLYSLQFPRKDFNALPESVQWGYRLDANKILTWLQQNEDTDGTR